MLWAKTLESSTLLISFNMIKTLTPLPLLDLCSWHVHLVECCTRSWLIMLGRKGSSA